MWVYLRSWMSRTVRSRNCLLGWRFATYRCAADVRVLATGTRTTATCRLEAMAQCEADVLGFDRPRLRSDWVVQRVRVRHRALEPVRGEAGTLAPARILRVDDVDRMRRWDDDPGRDHVDYIVDVTPATP